MRIRLFIAGLTLSWLPLCGAQPAAGKPAQVPAIDQLIVWSVSLLTIAAVLSMGFWGARKIAGIRLSASEKLHVSGGLSLGWWEKIVLLRAGRQELILAVTPGRIQALHVLDDSGPAAAPPWSQTDHRIPSADSPVSGAGNSKAFATEELGRLAARQGYETRLASVRHLIDQNPKLAAQTLKAWIQE